MSFDNEKTLKDIFGSRLNAVAKAFSGDGNIESGLYDLERALGLGEKGEETIQNFKAISAGDIAGMMLKSAVSTGKIQLMDKESMIPFTASGVIISKDERGNPVYIIYNER